MKRRDFFKYSAGVASIAGAFSLINHSNAQEQTSREFYELRKYQLRRGPMQKLFDDYCREAAIPAMNRLGINYVGVFFVTVGPDNPCAYVLIPYKSMNEFITAHLKLYEDKEYQKAGAEFINAPPTSPAYIRFESSLMLAFEGMSKLEVPSLAKEKKSRIFELRIYESHSMKAHLKKVEMFNTGEIELFRRTGLQPVFFGQTLVGGKLPNLTYMLVFENMAARDKNWGVFASDPDWKKMSSTPGFTDPEIVTNITNIFLRPAPYSQI
ncbi:MAG: NIPSNAP family protein [Verrucomicrobiae bacterium]|nr:NIPSNAP family protein [Verrucomicrobiae bacterium]